MEVSLTGKSYIRILGRSTTPSSHIFIRRTPRYCPLQDPNISGQSVIQNLSSYNQGTGAKIARAQQKSHLLSKAEKPVDSQLLYPVDVVETTSSPN